MKTLLFLATLTLIFLSYYRAEAQEGIKYTNQPYYQMGFTVGQFLPFGIIGVRDNYPWHGVHFSHPTRLTYIEYMLLSSNAKGVTYYNGSASFRTDYTAYDIDNGFFVMGFSIHRYKRKRTVLQEFDFVNVTGVHAGFGFEGKIVGPVRGRADLKFYLSPGKAVYFGIGLVYRFGGEDNDT